MFGLPDFFCNIDTAFNYAHNCCSFLRDWRIDDALHNRLMVYNFKNLTLDHQEWITPKEEHSHTDLGLMIRNVDYSTGNFDVRNIIQSYQNFCQICCTKNYKPFVAAPTTEMYCCQLQVRPNIDNLYGFFQFFLIRSQNINQYG